MKSKRAYIIIAVHVLCWLIFLSLPALLVAGLDGSMIFTSLFLNPSAWLYFTSYIVIFYFHTNFLLPKLYFRKKYVLYFAGLILLLIAIFYLRPFDHLAHLDHDHKWPLLHQTFLPPPSEGFDSGRSAYFQLHANEAHGIHSLHRPKLDIVSIILFMMIIALSITVVVIKRWRLAVEYATKAEADKVSAELAMLKAQINPHFLFNTLNNIYSQAIMKDEHTAESIMKLSNIMRYVTDDATRDFVSLISETNFISDYVELQRLRLGSKVTLDFSISGEPDDKMIAPLILITFIENVFKYGISNNEPSVITIELKTDEHSISFFCRNKLFPFKEHLERTGIGITNTKKRLEHFYPGKHIFNIKEEDGFFSVYLVLHH